MTAGGMRVLVVGHGEAGSRHVRSLLDLAANGVAVELAGICDLDPARFLPGVPGFTDINVALDRLRPDALCLTVNETEHIRVVRALHGYPHRMLILSEKPLTSDVADQAAAVDVLRRHEFGMNMVERYSPICAAYLEWAEANGAVPVAVRGTWGKDRTYDARPTMVVLSDLIHPVDLTTFLLGIPADAVEVVGSLGYASNYPADGDVRLDSVTVQALAGRNSGSGAAQLMWHSSFTWAGYERRIEARLSTPEHGDVLATFDFDFPHGDDDTLTLTAGGNPRTKTPPTVLERWEVRAADLPEPVRGISKFRHFLHTGLQVSELAPGATRPAQWTDLAQAVGLQNLLDRAESALPQPLPSHAGFQRQTQRRHGLSVPPPPALRARAAAEIPEPQRRRRPARVGVRAAVRDWAPAPAGNPPSDTRARQCDDRGTPMTSPLEDAQQRGDYTSLPVLEAYFANVLPADPNALISIARDSNAPDELINALIRLPSAERYETAEQLSAALTDGPL